MTLAAIPFRQPLEPMHRLQRDAIPLCRAESGNEQWVVPVGTGSACGTCCQGSGYDCKDPPVGSACPAFLCRQESAALQGCCVMLVLRSALNRGDLHVAEELLVCRGLCIGS